jgi:hypothetical protein
MTADEVCFVMDQVENQKYPKIFNKSPEMGGGDMSNGLGTDTRLQVDTHDLHIWCSFL